MSWGGGEPESYALFSMSCFSSLVNFLKNIDPQEIYACVPFPNNLSNLFASTKHSFFPKVPASVQGKMDRAAAADLTANAHEAASSLSLGWEEKWAKL